jgi:hypothetical protein
MSLNDVSEAFDGWLEILTGERSTGSFVNGRWVKAPESGLSFNGVVQNANPDDLKVLPEGNRTDEAIKIHTTFELVPQIGTTTTGDTIFYKGFNWLVYNVAHRYIGNYHKAIAVKREAIT